MSQTRSRQRGPQRVGQDRHRERGSLRAGRSPASLEATRRIPDVYVGMESIRVLVRRPVRVVGLGAVRKLAAPTPPPRPSASKPSSVVRSKFCYCWFTRPSRSPVRHSRMMSCRKGTSRTARGSRGRYVVTPSGATVGCAGMLRGPWLSTSESLRSATTCGPRSTESMDCRSWMSWRLAKCPWLLRGTQILSEEIGSWFGVAPRLAGSSASFYTRLM